MILAQILIKQSDLLAELQQKLFDSIELHNIQLDSIQIAQINEINDKMNDIRLLLMKIL
jgi:hypothetical protein